MTADEMRAKVQRRRIEALPDIIRRHAAELRTPIGSDIGPARLLIAIAKVESSFGVHGGRLRVEPAYLPASRLPGTHDGPLFRRHVRDLFALYGDAACGSWSSWQIMYPTAWELGFRGEPWDLFDDEKAIVWVCAYLNVRAFGRGAKTLADMADAYNSGDHRDRFVPTRYIEEIQHHYDQAGRDMGVA